MASPSGKKIDQMYKTAWLKGLKTTYYFRSLGATDAEKSTVDRGKLNAVSAQISEPQACSIDNPDCEACQ
jgi:ribonucleoside-diphosphate reductase alpha chain